MVRSTGHETVLFVDSQHTMMDERVNLILQHIAKMREETKYDFIMTKTRLFSMTEQTKHQKAFYSEEKGHNRQLLIACFS